MREESKVEVLVCIEVGFDVVDGIVSSEIRRKRGRAWCLMVHDGPKKGLLAWVLTRVEWERRRGISIRCCAKLEGRRGKEEWR